MWRGLAGNRCQGVASSTRQKEPISVGLDDVGKLWLTLCLTPKNLIRWVEATVAELEFPRTKHETGCVMRAVAGDSTRVRVMSMEI